MMSTRSMSLLALAAQNTAVVLCSRYSRMYKEVYSAAVLVLMIELAKLATFLGIHFSTSRKGAEELADSFKGMRFIKISVPAILYLVQNNLMYIALIYISAPKYQVLAQLKLVLSAILSYTFLGRSLACRQWAAVLTLTLGVSLVQADLATDWSSNDSNFKRTLIGSFLTVILCMLSSFSGVYFEAVLKDSRAPSIWLSNVQLAMYGIVFSVFPFMREKAVLTELGLFHGFTTSTWMIVVLQVLGGALTGVVLKYADAVAKGFAVSLAVVASAVLSIPLFGFSPTFTFALGSLVVVASIAAYAQKPPAQRNPHSSSV